MNIHAITSKVYIVNISKGYAYYSSIPYTVQSSPSYTLAYIEGNNPSKLKIHDLDQYFNTRLPRDHVKKDSNYFATNSLWNLIINKKILNVVEKILGPEVLSNPVQNTRIKQPEKKLQKKLEWNYKKSNRPYEMYCKTL